MVNPNFILPHMDQFSFGFQYELPKHSKLDASYVGSRGKNLESSQAVNFIPLSLRQQCDAWEGGTAAFCQALVPNPFYQVAPFSGTSYFSSPTLARSTLAAPYPQFGGITMVDANANASWYNSFQIGYEVRTRNGLTLVANWTLSKQVYQNGYNDIQRLVPERSIYQYDQPHNFKISAVYQLPFGKGRPLLEYVQSPVQPVGQRMGDQRSLLLPFGNSLETAHQFHLCPGSQDAEYRLARAHRAGGAALRGAMEYQRDHHHAVLQHEGRLHQLQLPVRCRSSRRPPNRFTPDRSGR